MSVHFVSKYSEGVSCQSQRRFPEEMGESSTGEKAKQDYFVHFKLLSQFCDGAIRTVDSVISVLYTCIFC